jgi:hypothetical protein
MIGLSNALYPCTFSELAVHIGPAQFFINDTLLVINPTVAFLEPMETNFIYLSFSGGGIGISQIGYANNSLPICRAVCDEEKVLQLFDDRPDFSNMQAGGSSPHFSDAEIPAGAINGTNTDFALTNSPTPAASLILMLNGLLQTEGTDYTLLNQSVTFAIPPVTGDTIVAWYRY